MNRAVSIDQIASRSCQPAPRLQDTELARISQAGMPDILQRASWRSAKPKTAVVVRQPALSRQPAKQRSGMRARKKLTVNSECPPLVMPLSQSCKEKLQLQPSSAALLLPSEGGCQPEKKPLHL